MLRLPRMVRRFLPLLLLFCSPSPAESVASVNGLELGTLTLGKRTFHEVKVRSRDERSVFFTHRDGLGSARLRDLPATMQNRLGFDPAAAPEETPPAPLPRAAPPAKDAASADAWPRATSRLEALFLAYESAPELRLRQTLQPDFIRLGLAAKNQGRRPSCAVYAVVSALEFQGAGPDGAVERLSEDYLIWATRRSLGLSSPASSLLRDPATGELVEDEGFTLTEVIAALQTYGIPAEADAPPRAGASREPDAALIERARARRQVFIAPLPGREPAIVAPRIVHALNTGFPVPVGLRWPNERAIRAGVLSAQSPAPGAAHAVTIVGYECATGRIEDAVFVFKNSYGPRWGQGGYGRVTHGYLARHLLGAYVLDVRAPGDAP